MDSFIQKIDIRWADLDPNFHVRHSVYYDWGANCRFGFFVQQGLTTQMLTEYKFGPILFREECTFRREVHFGDSVNIDLQLVKARPDFSRWSIRHGLYKNDNTLAATILVDGAWIDTQLRKLTVPAEQGAKMMDAMPKSPDFEWINK